MKAYMSSITYGFMPPLVEGKTYTYKEDFKYPFRFYKTLKELSNSTPLPVVEDPVYVVEILGTVDIVAKLGETQRFTDKFRVIKPYECRTIKRDEKGRIIDYKDLLGFSYSREYENDLLCHYKDSTGIEYWRQYDDKGRLIHYKNVDGIEYFVEYVGNFVYTNYPNGQKIQEFNENNREIYFDGIHDYKVWKQYENDCLTYVKVVCRGVAQETWREYDKDGQIIHNKTVRNNALVEENWYKYQDGLVIYSKDVIPKHETDTGIEVIVETWNEYKNRKPCYTKEVRNGKVTENWCEHDENGNLTYLKMINFEIWYKYDENGCQIAERKIQDGVQSQWELIIE